MVKFSKEEQADFNFWKQDGNVSKNDDGTYSTQDAQYTNSLKDMDALKEYYLKEFLSGSRYTDGGEVEYEIKRIVNEAKNQKKNTHFAIHKPTNSIVFTWDYSEYDTKELNAHKEDYFYIDVKDVVSGNVDKYVKSDFAIVQRKDLEKRGIDLNNYLVFVGQKYDRSESKNESDGGEAGFDDAGTSMVMYHEKRGNFITPKGQIYLWLYEGEKIGEKLQNEQYDWVFYPFTSHNMAFQSGYIPPLKRVWTKKFQKEHKGAEHLLGLIKAYLIEKEGEKELFIDMMSVNPNNKKEGIMSYMIKDLRNAFNLSQDQVTFSKLTKEGEKFIAKKQYGDGGGVGEFPPKGELTNKDNFLLKYEKKGGEYEFLVYKPITKEVSGYNQIKHVCLNKDCPQEMTYEQFINYLYAELYLDDTQYADGGEIKKPNIYFYNDGEQDITFTTFEQAYNEVQRLGYSKFRDNLGGEYFVNKDLTKKTIYQHKSNPYITLEFLEDTNKGVKGLQKNPKSLSKKERTDGIIVYYSDSEMKQLFDKKYSDGGSVWEKNGFTQYPRTSPKEWELVEWSLDGHSPYFKGRMYFQANTGLMFIAKENDEIYTPKSSNKLFWRKHNKYGNGGGVDNYLSSHKEMFDDNAKTITKKDVVDFIIISKNSDKKYWVKDMNTRYSYYIFKGNLRLNNGTGGIFSTSITSSNTLKDEHKFKIKEEDLYDWEKELDPNKERVGWESIIYKFGEVYYSEGTDNNELVSDQVKAEEYQWQFDRYSKYASSLSWADAEDKFKKSLTADELNSIEISYKKEEYADLEEHDTEKYHKQIVVKLKTYANGGETRDEIEDKIAGLKLRIAKTKKQISGYETTERGKYNKLFQEKVVPLQKELDTLSDLYGKSKYEKGGAIYPDLSLIKADVVNDSVVLDEFEIKKTKNTFTINGLENKKIKESSDIVRVLRSLWEKDTINAYEQSYVLYLNKSNNVIGYYHHSSGGIDGTIMDVQMISGMALKSLAKGVIIAHNHPSESKLPSDADKRITNQIKDALKVFNILLLDSIIITDESYFSFCDEGLI